MSTDWVAKQKALHNWVVACTGMPADKVIWGGQQGPRTTQPGIVMKLSSIQDDGRPWLDVVTSGDENRHVARSLMKVILTLECFTEKGVGLDMAQAILWRINTRRLLSANAAILENANIGVIEVDRVRVIQGVQDLVLFEPRAFVDIHLHITSEDSEIIDIIEHAEITGED